MKTTCWMTLCVLLLMSCKNQLSEEQKVFLDFARLEDRYSGTQFYNNLYLSDYTVPGTTFDDKQFSIKTCTEKLKQQLKFINDPEEGSISFGGLDEVSIQEILPYPSMFFLNRQGDRVQVTGKVLVPESVHTFSFDSTETGKTIHKDSMKITLLDMSNNVATLLVTDETERRDYNYTYDMFDRSAREFNGKKADSLKPGYYNLFSNDYNVSAQSFLNRRLVDSTVYFDNSRLQLKGVNKNGAALFMSCRQEDFRHYLWYRNHDMPYPDMVSDYAIVRSAFREPGKNPDHFFSPLYIMTIAVAGKLQKVEGVIRSSKGKTEEMVLGQFPVLSADQNDGFKPVRTGSGKIPEVNAQNVSDFIRAGSFEVHNRDLSKNVCLYVSVPVTENILEQNLFSVGRKSVFYPYIREVLGITAKGDTIEIKNTENVQYLLPADLSLLPADHIAAVTIPKPGVVINTYICITDFSLLPMQTSAYNSSNLPQGFNISSDRKQVLVPNDMYPAKINLYNGNTPLLDIRIKEQADSSGTSLVYRTQAPVDKIEVLRFKDERVNLPVNVRITPQKQK